MTCDFNDGCNCDNPNCPYPLREPSRRGLDAEQLRQKIYDLWYKAKADFGQASWQKLVREEIEVWIQKAEHDERE